jgi:hypothetical protein
VKQGLGIPPSPTEDFLSVLVLEFALTLGLGLPPFRIDDAQQLGSGAAVFVATG